jgi:hypothetical protein
MDPLAGSLGCGQLRPPHGSITTTGFNEQYQSRSVHDQAGN